MTAIPSRPADRQRKLPVNFTEDEYRWLKTEAFTRDLDMADILRAAVQVLTDHDELRQHVIARAGVIATAKNDARRSRAAGLATKRADR